MTKEKDSFKIMPESLAPEEYGVGVKKGNEELQTKLQKALDEMNEDGTAAQISNKWFGEDKVLK
jgi:polar amino acid transport system substrate-binding protein